jgi:uncharacterized protein (DUF1015 family)
MTMAVLKPFKGLRPPKDKVLQVAAPPYDVVNAEEARAYAKGNPFSFFHVSRPEIDLPGVDEHTDAVYARGRENLKAFVAQGLLKPDFTPRFYVYRQRMGTHLQVGLVAGASVEEYDRGLIKKHELTRADKEDDRTRHVDEMGANDEPVFLTYRADPRIDALIAEVTRGVPEYDFVTEDQIGHTFWVVSQDELNARLEEAFKSVPHLYIADGHHRSAAASRVRKLAQGRNRASPGHERFLAVVFPHDQMQILDYNRVVKDLHGRAPEQFLKLLEEKFTVAPSESKKPSKLHGFGMYLGKQWYALTAKPGTFASTPTGVLDVSILQNNVLGPLLGIGDPRTDKRIHFVGGARGTAELEKLVDSGAYAVAFSMFPTSLEQLMSIADAGEIMPPKSTWFEPKLRSGLVVHAFE